MYPFFPSLFNIYVFFSLFKFYAFFPVYSKSMFFPPAYSKFMFPPVYSKFMFPPSLFKVYVFLPVYSKFISFSPVYSKFKTFNEECFFTCIRLLIGMLNKWVNCVFSPWSNRKLCVLGFLTDPNVFRGKTIHQKNCGNFQYANMLSPTWF
jgi:hypothetical protein